MINSFRHGRSPSKDDDDMTIFRPKYISFDCYGTLINFQMAEAARDLYGDRLDEAQMQQFIKNFAAYRLDEIMDAWPALCPGGSQFAVAQLQAQWRGLQG